MKWMGWGPDDLATADPELIEEAIRLINKEAAEYEALRNR